MRFGYLNGCSEYNNTPHDVRVRHLFKLSKYFKCLITLESGHQLTEAYVFAKTQAYERYLEVYIFNTFQANISRINQVYRVSIVIKKLSSFYQNIYDFEFKIPRVWFIFSADSIIQASSLRRNFMKKGCPNVRSIHQRKYASRLDFETCNKYR